METKRCRICGRQLKDYRECEPDDPAVDCGGDCAACMRQIEENFPDYLTETSKQAQ